MSGVSPRRVYVRHKVMALTFLLGVVLYIDRAALSVLAPAIRRDLEISPMAMGLVFSAFVWGYALFHVPSGWLADRFGARRVLTAIVVVWSAFTAATASAWSLASLLTFRFLFGAGEAGATPSVSYAFARWAPKRERAQAQGFYFAGMSAGAAIAPALATVLLLRFGWRITLILLGALGLFWAIVWYFWFRDRPQDHTSVTQEELATLSAGDVAPLTTSASQQLHLPWRKLASNTNLWAILLMYFTYGYTGYIYISWFPTYLLEARQLPIGLAGLLSAIPSLAGLVAKPLGGWWSDRTVARRGVLFGRRLVGMIGFAIGALAVPPGIFVQDPYWAVFFLALADGGAALAHGVCFAVILDVGLKRAGTVSALMLTMGSLGNAISSIAFGAFVQYTGSWIPPFLLAMTANLAGCLLWLKIDPRRQLL